MLVQVTKDPIGHKGARLTSQISLPGRYLVYVPDGAMTGISRKLPDTERTRLKKILKEIVPDDAGVIVRTAAEGAARGGADPRRRAAAARSGRTSSKKVEDRPARRTLLYGEPDLPIQVVRDIFNEDFAKLVVSGDEAWDTVEEYVTHVAPDLVDRLTRWTRRGPDVFADYRIDEQIAKALDRKVWLPSGGSLVIDRTEAMTVVDVNTGKFTGSGGNLEETVTKNNLEAAEEIVRQLRLRDIGGIIVIDFIDMVLESNRDLVLRRLVECLGRDRTKHQVAEVTSLGLVQMTRKRIGTGLLEAFSEPCEHCDGRGVIVHDEPGRPGALRRRTGRAARRQRWRRDRARRQRRRRRRAVAGKATESRVAAGAGARAAAGATWSTTSSRSRRTTAARAARSRSPRRPASTTADGHETDRRRDGPHETADEHDRRAQTGGPDQSGQSRRSSQAVRARAARPERSSRRRRPERSEPTARPSGPTGQRRAEPLEPQPVPSSNGTRPQVGANGRSNARRRRRARWRHPSRCAELAAAGLTGAGRGRTLDLRRASGVPPATRAACVALRSPSRSTRTSESESHGVRDRAQLAAARRRSLSATSSRSTSRRRGRRQLSAAAAAPRRRRRP